LEKRADGCGADGSFTGKLLADTVTVVAIVVSDAVPVEGQTTEKDLKDAKAYAARYAGATTFIVEYTIVFQADGTLDQSKSTVKFTTVTYTFTPRPDGASRTETPNPAFTTLPITITSVALNPDKSVASFTFSSTDWYPGSEKYGIVNNGLTGTVDLKNGTSSYTASYKWDATKGPILNYNISGTFGNIGAKGKETERRPFVATPEPNSGVMVIAGLVFLAIGHRIRRKQTVNKSPMDV
jgi:hypothetical protein